MTASLRVGGRTVHIGNPDKTLFEKADEKAGRGGDGAGGAAVITKAELAEYYRSVGRAMLPHLRGRPVALHRFPDGVAAGGFLQKQRPDNAPEWLGGTEVPRQQGGSITMPVCDGVASLVWLADQGTIALHPWLSRADRLDDPDRIVFDLDPPGDDFDDARWAALALRGLLDELELLGFPMTTGSRGLHVAVPIRRRHGFDTVRDVARTVAELLADRYPDRLTTQVRKERRGGRLFIDILRNAYAQHAVAPYAVRPTPEAPVATPVGWDEVEALTSARRWTIRDIPERLERTGDPWRGMAGRARSLDAVRARLVQGRRRLR